MKYTIKKGKHYNFWHLFLMPFSIMRFKPVMKFTFKLSKECWFKPVETDDFDINKLYGRSFGLHHKNSVRLGWVPMAIPYRVRLYVYWYNWGIRYSYPLEMVGIYLDQEYTVRIEFETVYSRFLIYINDELVYDYNHYEYPEFKIGYKLRPYFGGNKTAPQTMTFEINDL